MSLARYVGSAVVSFARYLGELAFLVAETVQGLLHGHLRPRLVMQQILEIGFRSQPVILVTGAFTGAVFATQAYFQFHRLEMDAATGPVVSVSMFRELGPVLCGLMVAGRVGAAMSAELGTMKVTEQLDALRALGVHPVDYLVLPRFLAMLVSMPLLVAECIAIGIFSGYIVTTKILGVSEVYYLYNMLHFTGGRDVAMGLIKGVVFGILIVFISCHQGLHAKEGAVGVGRATTEAVVIGSLFILVVNFFLTMTLNIFFPAAK